MTARMPVIRTREEFRAFASAQGVRPDWHEPDEQNLTARVEGVSFDNAGFWPTDRLRPEVAEVIGEAHVVFSRTADDGHGGTSLVHDLAAVNLASLCAWAAEL